MIGDRAHCQLTLCAHDLRRLAQIPRKVNRGGELIVRLPRSVKELGYLVAGPVGLSPSTCRCGEAADDAEPTERSGEPRRASQQQRG